MRAPFVFSHPHMARQRRRAAPLATAVTKTMDRQVEGKPQADERRGQKGGRKVSQKGGGRLFDDRDLALPVQLGEQEVADQPPQGGEEGEGQRGQVEERPPGGGGAQGDSRHGRAQQAGGDKDGEVDQGLAGKHLRGADRQGLQNPKVASLQGDGAAADRPHPADGGHDQGEDAGEYPGQAGDAQHGLQLALGQKEQRPAEQHQHQRPHPGVEDVEGGGGEAPPLLFVEGREGGGLAQFAQAVFPPGRGGGEDGVQLPVVAPHQQAKEGEGEDAQGHQQKPAAPVAAGHPLGEQPGRRVDRLQLQGDLAAELGQFGDLHLGCAVAQGGGAEEDPHDQQPVQEDGENFAAAQPGGEQGHRAPEHQTDDQRQDGHCQQRGHQGQPKPERGAGLHRVDHGGGEEEQA